MRTILCLFISGFLFAEESKFSVEKLKENDVKSLEAANSALEAATARLSEAIAAVDKAKTVRDSLQGKILSRFGAFEGECVYPATSSNGSIALAVVRIPSRQFVRVELRGVYALITRGMEHCAGSGIVNSDNVIRVPASQGMSSVTH